MFVRSFRIFNVRFSVRIAVVNTPKYRMFFHPLSDDEYEQDANVAGNSKEALLKALPDVAKEISMEFLDDIRVVIRDLDNDSKEIASIIGFYVPTKIISSAAVSLTEVITFK